MSSFVKAMAEDCLRIKGFIIGHDRNLSMPHFSLSQIMALELYYISIHNSFGNSLKCSFFPPVTEGAIKPLKYIF